jgi:hypothetical protein
VPRNNLHAILRRCHPFLLRNVPLSNQ